MFRVVAGAIAIVLGTWSVASAIEAFPGAEGHGRLSRGGRDGTIIPVTTLNDAGPGSLRACIEATGPRVCVFRVGGVIRFTTTRPIISNPYLTIAGQTAPGGGVLLTHAGGASGLTPLVIKNTSDVVVRHVRVRLDKKGATAGSNDAITIEGSRDVIIDHVSGSWALDENINGYALNDNITISWSIFAEGLRPHDKCALLGSNKAGSYTPPQKLSFVKNLCAHHGDRNPDINFAPGSCIEVVNNVLYNGAYQFAEVWESYGGSPVDIINNYFKSGPSTVPGSFAIVRETTGSTGQASIYHAGNELDGGMGLLAPNVPPAVVAAPVCPPAVDAISAASAYAEVLARAGAFPRDKLDKRIVGEVRNRTGSIKKAPGELPGIENGKPYPDDDGDGMSNIWESANGLNPSTQDAWLDQDGDGWPNLDEFLNYAHEERLSGRTVK